jgi:hypothetical protein
MNIKLGFVVAALVCLGIALPASAQPMGPGFMGPGMMGRGLGATCNPAFAGFSDWRIERIERIVRPDQRQKEALNELRNASGKAAEALAASCPKDFPKTASERFAFMEKRMEAMLQAIRTVRPAFDAFYGTLDVEQKARLDAAGRGRWGWGHRWRDW